MFNKVSHTETLDYTSLHVQLMLFLLFKTEFCVLAAAVLIVFPSDLQ